jgi:hypothetical protein
VLVNCPAAVLDLCQVHHMLSLLAPSHNGDARRLCARVDLEAGGLHLTTNPIFEPNGEGIAAMDDGALPLQ